MRLLLLLRRHLAGVHPKNDFRPALGTLQFGEVSRQRVEPEVALLLLLIVTPETVLPEKGQHLFFKSDGLTRCGSGEA